jgi:hypothetical protein
LQFFAYALAVGLTESEVLVVQGPCQAAAEQACGQPKRGNQRHRRTDADSFAEGAFADLVGLKLALVVQDQDADGILLRYTRFLQ